MSDNESTNSLASEPGSPPPSFLESNDLAGVAKYIGSGQCNNIIFMLGAGVSTAAGIPDFRSPDTGLYANLARLKLPFPEAVFEMNFFRRNPVPFYTLAQELYPGKYLPTLSHAFMRLLSMRSLVHTIFTQNIDTLERRAGIPASKIIEAHGSFATQRCIVCKTPYDDEKMKAHVRACKVPKCERKKCNGLVKPDIVFFGESLPQEFTEAIPNLAEADLLIVMGTSLTVHPFASLTRFVPRTCPRVLINLERVGDMGSRPNDVILLGKCDSVVKDICAELGWGEELDKTWKAIRERLKEEAEQLGEGEEVKEIEVSLDQERLQVEVDKLTEDIAKKLAVKQEAAKAAHEQEKIDRSSDQVRAKPTGEGTSTSDSEEKKRETPAAESSSK